MPDRFFTALLILSIVFDAGAFLYFGSDKRKAAKGEWRTPESALLKAALIGPFGAWAGMRLFRHKTRKTKFRLLVPVFMLLRIALLIGILRIG